MKRYPKLILFFLMITFYAAQAQKIKVRNLYAPGTSSKGVIYALPQTVISVSVEVTKTIYKQGPYAEFASEYLGITDAPESDSSYYEITQINTTNYRTVDPGQCYVIESKQKDLDETQYQQFKNEGLIIDVTGFSDKYKNKGITLHGIDDKELAYKDLSYQSFFNEKVDTFYKKVLTDSTYRRVPVLKKQLERETIEEKAEEAADLIFQTRERRMKLVAGEFDFIPDGQSLKISIDELNKIEEDYLSLFFGKTYKQVKTYNYNLIPQSEQPDEIDTLCYFSGQHGISSSVTIQSRPLLAKISKIQTKFNLETFNHKTPGVDAFTDQIIYRLPNPAELTILLDRKELLNNRIYIDQYGVLVGF